MDKFMDHLPWYLMGLAFTLLVLCGIVIKVSDGIKEISRNF